MSVCVQVHYDLDVPTEQYLAGCRQVAEAISASPGLRWKLFVIASDGARAGGVYLFDDRASAEAYLAGPVIAGLRTLRGVHDVRVEINDVSEALSRATGAGQALDARPFRAA
jgi:hypothetical protein